MCNLSVHWLQSFHECSPATSQGYLTSSVLLPPPLWTPSNRKPKLSSISNPDSPDSTHSFLSPVSESGESWRLFYEAVKLSNDGGGNPIVSRSLTNEKRNGGAVSNGIDGKGDESPKVQDTRSSLGVVFEDDFERRDNSSSR